MTKIATKCVMNPYVRVEDAVQWKVCLSLLVHHEEHAKIFFLVTCLSECFVTSRWDLTSNMQNRYISIDIVQPWFLDMAEVDKDKVE